MTSTVVTGLAGTLLGPLTTVWTGMPASCTVNAIYGALTGYQGQQCLDDHGNQQLTDNSACWPPAASAGPKNPPLLGWGYYSPGLACPSGYVTACTAQYGGHFGWDVQFNLVSGETAVGCCPSYTCSNSNGNTCVATATSNNQMVVPTGVCSGNNMNSGTATFPDVITVTRSDGTSTQRRIVTLYAPMFQLNFKASDLPSSSTTSAPTTAASPGSTSDASRSSPQSTSTVSSPPAAAAEGGGGGISTGAAAGAGVGAALGAVLLLAVVFWVCRRKRRQRAAAAAELHGGHMADDGSTWTKQVPSYHPQSTPFEMNSGHLPVELDHRPAAELESTAARE